MDDYNFRRTAGHLTFLVAILAALMALMIWVPRAHAQQLNVSVTPVSTGKVSGAVIKAAPGRLYKIAATNATATAGFFVVLNVAAVPSGSASITPVFCRNIPASGTTTIDFMPTPSAQFSTGIVAVVTSASDCGTYTTGTITAYFDAIVQ